VRAVQQFGPEASSRRDRLSDVAARGTIQVKKPRVYVETTIPSYPTAWPSRDLLRAAHQQVTREWWDRRAAFDLYVSPLVLVECQAGDPKSRRRPAGRRGRTVARRFVILDRRQACGPLSPPIRRSLIEVSAMHLLRVSSALLIGFLAAGSLDAADERLAVPAPHDQARSEKLIKRLFQSEYSIKTPSGMKALAGKLLGQAVETNDDPTGRYVLLREAAVLAASAGELDLALKAADLMAKHYHVSGADIKATVFETAARSFVSAELSKVLAERALAAANEGFETDDYPAVIRLMKIAEPAARTAKSEPLITAVQARAKEAEMLNAEYKKLSKVLALLLVKPDDPDANLAAGKFYCFYKGNWDTGLPMLAKGRDDKLKELAARDGAAPVKAAAQIELGEAWLMLSEEEKDVAKKHLQWRARHWFEQALPSVTGLTRTKVEAYLKDIPLRERASHSLNEREKRVFRWAIDFGQGRSPADYLTQLQSMGAFLGVPDKLDPKDKKWKYKFIHDLRRGHAKLDDDDATAAKLIRWYHNDAVWSEAIMRELGIKAKPDHFIVYFPLELEQQFADEENRYLNAHKLELPEIERTYFRLDYKNKRYVPVATSHELKARR
jgi:hypothetical protein